MGPAVLGLAVVGVLWLDAPAGGDEFQLGSRTGSGFGQSTLFGDVEIVSDAPRVEPMFHSCEGLAVEGQLHAAWIDRRDFPTEGHNVYHSNRTVAPNLCPLTPAGWDPALCTCTSLPNLARAKPSAIWLLAAFATHKNSSPVTITRPV